MKYKLFVVTEVDSSTIEFDEIEDADIAFNKMKKQYKVTKLYAPLKSKKTKKHVSNIWTDCGEYAISYEILTSKEAKKALMFHIF